MKAIASAPTFYDTSISSHCNPARRDLILPKNEFTKMNRQITIESQLGQGTTVTTALKPATAQKTGIR
ncbi:MAG TPA: hypothetical protein VII92_07100 [Anaerolineae bacterium]